MEIKRKTPHLPGYGIAAMAASERALLTTAQAARFLNLSTNTLKWWRTRNRERGPAYFRLHKNAVRYSRKDLGAWLRARHIKAKVA